MKVSEFLKTENIPAFLLGSFFGRYNTTKDNKNFYTYSAYRNGTIYSNKNLCEQSKTEYVNQLNCICQSYPFWVLNKTAKFKISKTDIYFLLENDLNLTGEEFFNKLYSKILSSKIIYEQELSDNKKMFIRGVFELRGSIDRSLGFFANDYKNYSKFELKRANILSDFFDIPVDLLNYNFRELQDEYIQGKHRDTQIRPDLMWYANKIGFINKYKTEVFANCFPNFKRFVKDDINYFNCPLPTKSENIQFLDRIKYHYAYLFNKKLTKNEIEELRKKLSFSTQNSESEPLRDNTLINIIKTETEDKCASCCDDYNIKDRSYLHKQTGKYYFEIHHVISLGKNKSLDDIDNLVKLCPTCHRALKRGSADELTQKNIIKNILNHSPKALEFAKCFFETKDLNEIIDKIWISLK